MKPKIFWYISLVWIRGLRVKVSKYHWKIPPDKIPTENSVGQNAKMEENIGHFPVLGVDPCIFCDRTNSLAFTAWSSAGFSCGLWI